MISFSPLNSSYSLLSSSSSQLTHTNIDCNPISPNNAVSTVSNDTSLIRCDEASPDDICYCYLTNVASHKTRFSASEPEITFVKTDFRTEAEIFREIYCIVAGIYPKDFKECIDAIICRDCSTKVQYDGIYLTHKTLKKYRKDWIASNATEDDKKVLKKCRDKMKVSSKDHPYHELFNSCKNSAT